MFFYVCKLCLVSMHKEIWITTTAESYIQMTARQHTCFQNQSITKQSLTSWMADCCVICKHQELKTGFFWKTQETLRFSLPSLSIVLDAWVSWLSPPLSIASDVVHRYGSLSVGLCSVCLNSLSVQISDTNVCSYKMFLQKIAKWQMWIVILQVANVRNIYFWKVISQDQNNIPDLFTSWTCEIAIWRKWQERIDAKI